MDDLDQAVFDAHPLSVVLDERLGGKVVAVRDDDGRRRATVTGDDQLTGGAGIAGQLHADPFVHLKPVVRLGALQVIRRVVAGGEAFDVAYERGRAHPQGDELDAAGVEFAGCLVGRDFLVHDHHARALPGQGSPMTTANHGFTGTGGLGDVRVGVRDIVGVAVLGIERKHAADTLGTGGHVVAFERGIADPVHDRMKVQAEDCMVRGGEPGANQLLVESSKKAVLVVVAGAIGVVGQSSLLW